MLVFINLGNKAHFLREKRINLLFRSTNNSTNIEIKVKYIKTSDVIFARGKIL